MPGRNPDWCRASCGTCRGKAAAPTSRISDSATCPVTSARPRREAPPYCPAPCSFKSYWAEMLVARRAGTRPNSRLVKKPIAHGECEHGRSGEVFRLEFAAGGPDRDGPAARLPQTAKSSPPGRPSPRAAGFPTSTGAARAAAPRRSPCGGDLALAGGGPGQQQVGDVGAGDQEDQADHGHQGEQRLAIFAAVSEKPVAAGLIRRIGDVISAPRSSALQCCGMVARFISGARACMRAFG